MTPHPRTPQQRDRRFARVRRLTQTVLIGSGLASGLFVGYAQSVAKPLTKLSPPTSALSTPTTVPPVAAPSSPATAATPSTSAPSTSAPSPAPVTTTTVCYSTPSGSTVCY